jgi:Tol biopolymer transport system component
LQKDPAQRFQSATEVQAALEEIRSAGAAASVPPRARASRTRVAVAGGAILLLVGAAGAGVWFWARPAAVPGSQAAAAEPALTPVVLTSYDGFEYSPSLSPDGTQVAFGWSPDGNADVYVKQLGVEDPYRLTRDPGRDLFPAWSPDGTKIAYYHFATDERIELSIMPQRGGAPLVVTELKTPAAAVDDLGAGMIAWTRDSANMIVSASEEPRKTCALYWVSVETGEKRRITSPPASVSGDINPALSADGRTLVFVRVRTEALTDLMRIDLDAEGRPIGDAVKLPAPYSITRAVSWTPDGTEILFDSGKSLSGGEIFRMKPVPGAVPALLKTLGEGVFGATASAQNRRLVYASHKNDANIWRLDLAGGNVRPPRRVVASTRNDSEPSISPDGKRLAFASSRSGTPEIWLCDADGSNMTKLTSFGGPSTHRPRWSPDGKYIAFYSDATGNREIYVSTPQGRIHRLTDHPSRDTNAEWSRDGSWIYFISDRSGRSEMWKAPSDGSGQPVPVEGVVDTALESPDGKWLYHSRGWPDTFSVWRSPAQGAGEAVLVADGLNSIGGWRLAGDGIYYIGKADEDGMYPLQFKNLTTGKIRSLTRILRPYWGISVTADRRSILYPQLDQSGSDLMLVENFK